MDTSKLEAGSYYRINNTKRVLYWDGSEWMSPVKDTTGRRGTWVVRMERQPRVIRAEITEV